MMEHPTTQNLPQKLSDDIVRLILDEHLKPGDKLPNEMLLSQQLGAGRSSVREAMKILASRNIVDIRQGSGTYVSVRMGVSDDPLGLVFLENDEKLVNDLMEIRFLVEPSIAAMAADHANEDDIAQIARFCDDTEAQIRAGRNHTRSDILFHQAIARSSKNLIVPRLVPIIDRTIEAFVSMTDRSLLEETIESHRDIAESIAAHDPEAAKDAMYMHLVYNRRFVRKAGAQKENHDA